MTVDGIDVSVYQQTTPSLTGLSFLFARASIGTRIDMMYAKHIAAAKKAGLVTGSYHFGDNRISPASQADAFLDAAGDVDFYWLDVEGRHPMSSAQCRAFFDAVHAAGKKVGLYHSLSGFPEAGQDFNWVAYWANTPPSINWTFWQWQGSPLDRDRFIGTIEELRALAGGGTDVAPVPITDETPKIVTAPAGHVWRDLDVTTILDTNRPALAPRFSPYGVNALRAIYATVGGVRRVVLITPDTVKPIPAPTDDTPYDQADLDATRAAGLSEGATASAAALESAHAAGVLVGRQTEQDRIVTKQTAFVRQP